MCNVVEDRVCLGYSDDKKKIKIDGSGSDGLEGLYMPQWVHLQALSLLRFI